MPSPVRPHETELSPWTGRAKVQEIRERWRVFCDAQVRRLNSPDPVGTPAREAGGAGDELTAVLPEGRVVVIDSPGGPGVERGRGFDAQG
jgi:hypothetical protein